LLGDQLSLEDDAGSDTTGYPNVGAGGDSDVDTAVNGELGAMMITKDDGSGACFELLGTFGGET
jgi:hypothetical protein